MADELDMAQELTEAETENLLAKAAKKAAAIPAGEPGECEGCGEDKPRLVRGHCGRFRDELGLP